MEEEAVHSQPRLKARHTLPSDKATYIGPSRPWSLLRLPALAAIRFIHLDCQWGNRCGRMNHCAHVRESVHLLVY